MTVVNPIPLGLMDSSHPQSVLSRLSEQRSQGLFCDVIIVVEDVKFRAHRNILAATSGYFHNAFKTPDVYTSSQVLELTDLKSEVFANILNFIYNAKVESSSAEDSKSLVAAGKRLGIPFLEKLLDSERQSSSLLQSQASASQGRTNSQAKLADTCILKKETLKPEESDCSKVPRITNAFSITEVGAVNNPFSVLDQGNKVIEALKEDHPSSSPQTTNISPVESEPAHALSEHSYAVSQGQESNDIKEISQGNDKKATIPTVVPAKTSVNHRLGPIKKRHIHGKVIPPLSNDPAATVPSTGVTSAREKAAVAPVSSSQMSSDAAPELHSSLNLLPPLDVTPPQDAEPPPLSPQNTTSVPTFCCQQCFETFSDSTLLTIHMQIHKRFVSHLFCKYCHKKFMHLKRLRNHEQVCVKSLKGPSELETNNKESTRVHVSNDTQNNAQHSLPPPDLHLPLSLEPTLTSPLEMPQDQVHGTVNTNSTSRVYKCSVCKRAYVTISSLKRHENVHSWHRAYPCHYCNKVFALAEYRTKHEIWHTGERRYQCIFCLETFLTYYILKNHQKSFHGIDPRLAMNKKSANGGLKSSVYPIKLYRLLPMKFRKKRYKSYSHTYSEGIENHEDSFSAPLDSCSPPGLFDSSVPAVNSDVVSAQSLFSMPVTFMATPKMMATEMPRISFDKPCDQSIEFPMPSEIDKSQKHISTDLQKKSTVPGFDSKGSPLFSYRFTDSSKAIQKNTGSSLVTHGDDSPSTEKNTENGTDILPFLNIPSVCSFEGLSRLSELSAAAQTIEDMANQLLQARPESITQDPPPSGKTETYIAKPACPGPSVDSQVLPLCQITVKIGNEAIVRRKIKGSKLFPKKRKRKSWRQEGTSQSSPTEDSIGSPSLRLRAEVTSTVAENESYDDPNDPETDKLWRPYYTYKPKKKGKKLRCKQKRIKSVRCYTRPLSPEANEDLRETQFSPDENISAENYEVRREQRHGSQREALPCHSCDSSFSSQTSLSMHIISCHQPCCRICGKQCSPEDTSSAAGPNAEGRGELICKSCTEDGSCFNYDAAPHSLSTEKRYRCSYCPQRFLYLATKKSHEKKHLEKSGKGHHCRYCSKVCKSAMLLDVHESKHFKAKDEEDPDMKCKMGSSFLKGKERKKQIKLEPWENTYTGSEIKPKIWEPMDRETEGYDPPLTNIYKKTSLSFPYAADKSFSSLSTEIKKRPSKKKSILERSKGFGFEGHRRDSVGAVIWGPQD